MKNKFSPRASLTFFAVIISVFAVVATVQAATTISTNIQTDGSLSVTGASTLIGSVEIGTSTALAPLTVGNYGVNNSVDSQILISRSVDSSVSGNGHAFSDSSNITRGGTIGYNSYDGRVTFSGTNNFDHYAAFQAGATYGSSGTINNMYGLVDITQVNSGTVSNRFGTDVWDVTGAGTVTNNYGLRVEQLTHGTNNWAIWTDGTTPSYFGGKVDIATTSASDQHGNVNVVDSVATYASGPTDTSFFAAYDENGTDFVALQKRGTQQPGHIGLADGAAELLSYGNDFGIYTYTNNYLALGTNNAERMRITNTGQVGIATTSPVANFQVANGNATTTLEFGSAGENKGTCLKLYRTDGSAIYAYVAAGATSFTLSTTACANVSNF